MLVKILSYPSNHEHKVHVGWRNLGRIFVRILCKLIWFNILVCVGQSPDNTSPKHSQRGELARHVRYFCVGWRNLRRIFVRILCKLIWFNILVCAGVGQSLDIKSPKYAQRGELARHVRYFCAGWRNFGQIFVRILCELIWFNILMCEGQSLDHKMPKYAQNEYMRMMEEIKYTLKT